VCSLASHPQAEEVWHYFKWKMKHTRIADNRLEWIAEKAAYFVRASSLGAKRASGQPHCTCQLVRQSLRLAVRAVGERRD
jgi:hypothetical protein